MCCATLTLLLPACAASDGNIAKTVAVVPVASVPRPAPPVMPEMPLDTTGMPVHPGSPKGSAWLMECVDALAAYVKSLEAALSVYERQCSGDERNE